MPKGPQGQKRPADVISNAVTVMKIATGEIEELPEKSTKNAAAVELGRMGGEARARALSAKKKTAIATTAAEARWAKKKGQGRGARARGRAK
jgi:hypothetical protein